jgi:tetratricopeptide (TPR) repeat protein
MSHPQLPMGMSMGMPMGMGMGMGMPMGPGFFGSPAYMYPQSMHGQQYTGDDQEQFDTYIDDDQESFDENDFHQDQHNNYEEEYCHDDNLLNSHQTPLDENEQAPRHEHTTSVAPTQQGYNEAWNRVATNLESGVIGGVDLRQGKGEYQFTAPAQNPYMHRNTSASGAQVSETDASTTSAAEAAAIEEEDISCLMQEGVEHYQAGRIREAVLCFEAVLQSAAGAQNDEAWRLLGACHAENDEDKRAILCLNRALDCDPYNLEALLALGTSYVNEADSVKALETLRTWVEHNPRFHGLQVPQDEYSDGSLMDEVMQLMLAVAAFDPADLDAQVVLGVLYNVSSDYDNAAECFSRVLQQRGDDYALVNKVRLDLT